MNAFAILFFALSFLHPSLTVPTVTSQLPLVQDETIFPSYGNLTELLMEQNTSKSSSNVKSFIQMVRNASLAVQKDVKLLEKKMSPAGIEFTISANILKKSSTEILSLASNIIQKLELAEMERIIRLFASKSLGIENPASYTFWLRNMASEIMEDVLHLKIHYLELSELYKAQLIVIGDLKKRLAVDGSINLFKEDAVTHKDEEESNSSLCKNGMFTCESGTRNITCVKYCNGFSECGDNSDEPKACQNLFSYNCGPGRFRCDDGLCIDLDRRCQTAIGCGDSSHNHYCEKITEITEKPFIPKNEAEEEMVEESIGEDTFTCDSGFKISFSRYCNGYRDCVDGSDEPDGRCKLSSLNAGMR